MEFLEKTAMKVRGFTLSRIGTRLLALLSGGAKAAARNYGSSFGSSSNCTIKDVEAALYLHPAIRDCVAIPEPVHCKEVLAFVTLRAELAGYEQELRDWVRGKIDACRTLERIIILRDLPKTPTGRLDRSALKDLAVSLETGIEIVT